MLVAGWLRVFGGGCWVMVLMARPGRDEGEQAVFHCLTPGFEDCEVQWHFNRIGTPLPQGVRHR